MAGYLHGIPYVTSYSMEAAMSNHIMVSYGLYLWSIAMANTRCFRRNAGK